MLNGYKIIAVCLSKVHEEASLELVKNLNELTKNNGYRLFIYSTNNDMFWNTASETGERAVFDLIDFSWVDLLVYCDESLKSDYIFEKLYKKAMEAGKPVFVFDGHRDGCVNINFDYTGGFENMVRHVVEHHGCKKIHYMSGIKGNSFSDEREGVVRNVMAENGLTLYDSDISYGHFWSQPTELAMQQYLQRKEPLPDAIICANDSMALEVSFVLAKEGYKIPEDIIVTGFDGIDQIFFSEPQISSCICDYMAIAKQIIDCYEDERKYEDKCGDYKVLPALYLSESCGCNTAKSRNAAEHIMDLSQRLSLYQNESRVMEEMASRIQTYNDAKDISRELRNVYMYNMSVVIKKDCLDESVNPMLNTEESSLYGDEFIVLLDSIEPERIEPIDFRKEQIIPHLSVVLSMGFPLIFSALHFLNTPLGYACFYFGDYDKISYSRAFQITSMLDNAFGGFRNIRYQRYLQGKIEDNYRLDSLTGLLNRTGFFREFDALIKKLQNEGGTLSLALADLDNLKFINDNYGHSEGDKAICAVAKALKRACPGALCCRFGGDEMIAVTAGPMDYRVVCGRVDMYMEEINRLSNCAVPFSASIGIYAVSRPEDMNFDEMLKVADAQMYEIKRAKKIRRGEKV